MSYVLATMENRVRWYAFGPEPLKPDPLNLQLLEVLDLDKVTIFHDKESAKIAARQAGLTTWRYVRL